MTGFAGNLNDQAIRETQCGAPSEMPYGGAYNINVLNRQMLVIQQHIDRGSDLFRRPFVHCIQHPHRLDQYQVRHPCTCGDERFRCVDLPGVVPH